MLETMEIECTTKPPHDPLAYKIVGLKETGYQLHYRVRCSITHVEKKLTIQEIIFDKNILCGLPAAQACFIGFQYAKICTEISDASVWQSQSNAHVASAYSKHQLLYQTRNGLLAFEKHYNDEQCVMDPIDIAFSPYLIAEFSSAQAFYIGLVAGYKYKKFSKN